MYVYEKKKVYICMHVFVCVCEGFLKAPMRLLLIKLEVARTVSGRFACQGTFLILL